MYSNYIIICQEIMQTPKIFYLSSIISLLTFLSIQDNFLSSMYHTIVHYFLLIIFFDTHILYRFIMNQFWTKLSNIVCTIVKQILYIYMTRNTFTYSFVVHFHTAKYLCDLYARKKFLSHIQYHCLVIINFGF